MRTAIASALVTAFLLIAAPAGAAVPADGKFKGETNLGQTVSIKVKDGAIASLLVVVQNTCGEDKRPVKVGGPIAIKGNGSFSEKLQGESGTLTFSGRFQGDSVSGRLREKYQNPLFGNCDTKRVDFDASRS